MLEKLAEKNSKWLSMAIKLCGCEIKAKDMVQDMYIKVYELNQIDKAESYKDTFIWGVMYSTMLDDYRKKQRKFRGQNVSLDYVKELQENNEAFELDDDDLNLLNRAKELRYLYRYYLEKNYDHSIRTIAEINNVNYGKVHRKLKAAREHILKDDFHKYKNKRKKR